MFNTLSERLTKTLKSLRGQGRLTDDNIKETLREVRIALLEADVALPVVKQFIEHVREKALGKEVLTSLDPGQAFVKIVNDELISTLGEQQVELNFNTQPPAVILMAGLQGSGKTTSSAKLAKLLTEQYKKKVLLVSTDVYRPAAIEQLKTLANSLNVDFHDSHHQENVLTIATRAISEAKRQFHDVVIIDTAGRLHVDDDMMNEIKQLSDKTNPAEILFVVDSMTGQDAANTAQAFNQALPLTGVILTKTDGDARGGAALSIRHITGKPIKFIGSSEKVDGLEAFHPDRIASRILGMGDILTLVEEAERKVDKNQAEKLAKKLKKGKGFDLEDFKQQIEQMNKMGGMMAIMGKVPGLSQLSPAMKQQVDESSFKRIVAIIDSMTPKERRHPQLINPSRKKRIAGGSGTEVQQVNKLLKQFNQMQKMMKKFAKPGAMQQLMRGFGGKLPGNLKDML